ncbi:MAG: putative ABC transporter permease subunit [Caulobacteraceae bacterium]
MSRYLVLTKVLMKNSNLLSLKPGRIGKKQIKTILLSVLIIAAFLPMMFGIAAIVYEAYGVLLQIQQEGLLLVGGFSVVSMAVFFFSIFYVMSVFYFSRDIENLLPLPLKPSEILAAKFTVTLIYEYLTEFLFLAPILISFGVASGQGIIYYLYSFIIFLTLPVIPLVYASLLSMIVMRFTNIARNKDRFRIVGGIIAMAIAIGSNLVIQKFTAASMTPEKLQQMITQGNNSLVGAMSGIFVNNRFGVIALLNNGGVKGLINIAVFVLISFLFLLLLLNLGESIYFKGVVGVSETASKKKRYSEKELYKSMEESPALKSYALKELKLLFRTPVYFMNCIMMNFLWPVFLLLPFIAQPEQMKELRSFSTALESGGISAVVLAAAFGISTFVTSANGITASAISREGRNIYVSKYLPISYKKQIMAKILPGIIMGAVATFMMLVVGMILFRVPALLIILIIVASFLGIVFSSFMGMFFDLNFPRLIWDNEQKAVKQNFNVVLNMLVSIIAAGIPVFIVIVLHFTLWTTFFILVALFGLLDVLLYVILSTVGVRLYKEIEG